MASAPRRSRTPTAAELERDAAQAVFALRQAQSELQELRCQCAMNDEAAHNCVNDKQSIATTNAPTNSNDDLNVAEIEQIQKRNDQILWHLGNLAEKMWSWCASATSNSEPSKSKCMRTLNEVKCVALEEFQSLIPNEDAYAYDEMHGLYKHTARHEKLQAHMEQELQRQALENEELRVQLHELSDRLASVERETTSTAMDAAPPRALSEELNEAAVRYTAQIHGLQRQLGEKEHCIDQLLTTIEDQAAEIDSLKMLNSALVFPSPATHDLSGAKKVNESRVPSGGQAQTDMIDDGFDTSKDVQSARTMVERIQPKVSTNFTSGTKSTQGEACMLTSCLVTSQPTWLRLFVPYCRWTNGGY
ncbi:hypothetical protein FI667_g1879, partial [Globisporangium splendens]